MIVITVAINVLIVPMAVTVIHFPDQAAVQEQAQGPVDGGFGYFDTFAPETQVELIHVKMLVDCKDFLEDDLPLRRAPETPSADIILKN
jgi:hypothetical protein